MTLIKLLDKISQFGQLLQTVINASIGSYNLLRLFTLFSQFTVFSWNKQGRSFISSIHCFSGAITPLHLNLLTFKSLFFFSRLK